MSKIYLSLILLVNACSTIHFTKGETPNKSYTDSFWHHDFIDGLIEGSSPVQTTGVCAKEDWQTITTEKTFLNGLASTLTSVGVFVRNSAGNVTYVIGLTVWDPWNVEISCKKN